MNAASNLLGICFLIIAGLRFADAQSRSAADEIAWAAAVCFLISLLLSYLTIREQDHASWKGMWSDRIFMVGVTLLTLATFVIGFALR